MDNFFSFRRFTSIDPNISNYGSTVEEIHLQHGKPDPNPTHSPMALQKITDIPLAIASKGSDKLRLNTPLQPIENHYDGSKMTLHLSRQAVQKLRGKIVLELVNIIQNNQIATSQKNKFMLASMNRIEKLEKFITHLNEMSNSIFTKTLASSKG